MMRAVCKLTLRAFPVFCLLALGLIGPGMAYGQTDAPSESSDAAVSEPKQASTGEETVESNADEDPEKPAPSDPLAVPEDATADELFDFIDEIKRNRGRTLESVKKVARAATDAATAIRQIEDVEIEDEIKAIREQLSALSFLSRYDADTKEELSSLVDRLKNDTREAISRFGALEEFKSSIEAAGTASKERCEELVSEFKELVKGHDFDRDAYSMAATLARTLERTSPQLAAETYDEIAALMRESSDESMQARADKMLGSARRLRLPGNLMEIAGTTADGEEFNWDQYRGKVVLVDFWASWCGPCRAEVPNMKRNLERYGEKGFEIVGVNLDRSLAAYSKYVEKEEIPWVSLFSDKEGERGWDNPLADYYGISAIPTAILVDQEGKVVSMRARGRTLDTLLAELLGEPDEPDESIVKIDPKADQILQQASQYLADMERFEVNANLSVKVEGDSQEVNLDNQQRVRVWRPNRLMMQSDQGDFGGSVTTISDGEKLYRFAHDANEYTVQDAPNSLGKIGSGNSAIIGMELMGRVLLQADLHESMLKGASELSYIESDTIESAETDRLRISRKRGGMDVWIQTGDKPVIRRIVPDVSAKRPLGLPDSSVAEVRLDLNDWNTDAEFQPEDFAFSVPNGASQTDVLFAELNAPGRPLHRLVGQSAPEIELPLYGGGNLDLASHRDQQVVILDFWASWCGPCRRAMPDLIEVAGEFKDRGVALYAVNLREDEETIGKFMEQTGLEVAVPMDNAGEIGRAYGARSIPQTVLIGKDGRVQIVHIGSSSTLADRLRSELDALLAGEDLAAPALRRQSRRMLADLVTPPGAWSPPEKPDGQAILAEAREDARAGRHELALEKHVWFHENILEHEPSMVGVRLSFALSAWKRLAREYPPAKEKLVELRDRALRDAKSNRDVRRNFQDFASINRYLDDTQLTAESFKWLDQKDSDVAESLFSLARPALIDAGEYELCSKYIDPESMMKIVRISLRRHIEGTDDERQQEMLERMADFTKKRIINDAATTAALLIIADRDDEAEQFIADVEAEWAKTKWEDADLQSALKSALKGKVPDPWP